MLEIDHRLLNANSHPPALTHQVSLGCIYFGKKYGLRNECQISWVAQLPVLIATITVYG